MTELQPEPSTDAQESAASEASASGAAKWLAGLLILLVAGGGVAFWSFSRGGGAARELAEQFIRDLSAADVAAAHAKCTPGVDLADLQRLAGYMNEWGKVQDISMIGRASTDADGAKMVNLQGTIEFSKLRKHFSAITVEVAGQPKIKSYSFD